MAANIKRRYQNYVCKNNPASNELVVAQMVNAWESKQENGDPFYSSMYKCAKAYGMSETKLRSALAVKSGDKVLQQRGRKSVLTPEQEQEICAVLRTLARNGFGVPLKGVPGIVGEFCGSHDIEAWGEGQKPCKRWVREFLDRQKLKIRKPIALSVSREEATRNPFIVLPFYDLIAEEIQIIKDAVPDPNDIPKHIWNLDETGFPYDPTPQNVVAGSGDNPHKKRVGEGRTYTSVLACVSAAGDCMPPFVVFKLERRPGPAMIKECMDGFRVDISPKSGWMNTSIFAKWFQEDFMVRVTQRPLLLLLDGHVSHLSSQFLEMAENNGITTIKLPPHTTDTLQPLDVKVFAALKQSWDIFLTEEMDATGRRKAISKPEFCEYLNKVWEKTMTSAVIQGGFKKAGVFPVDNTKYPAERFDTFLMRRYQRWLGKGAPELTDEEYDEIIKPSPKKKDPPQSAVAVTQRPPSSGTPNTPVEHIPPKPREEPIPNYPKPDPFKEYDAAWTLRYIPTYVPVWVPRQAPEPTGEGSSGQPLSEPTGEGTSGQALSVSTGEGTSGQPLSVSTPRAANAGTPARSPEESLALFHERIIEKRCQNLTNPTTPKGGLKRKMAMKVTTAKYIKERQEAEERTAKRKSAKFKNNMPPKVVEEPIGSSGEEDAPDHVVHVAMNKRQIETHLKAVADGLDDLEATRGAFFGIYFEKKPYFGKVVRWDGATDTFEVTFLEEEKGVAAKNGNVMSWPTRPDIELVKKQFFITRPLNMEFIPPDTNSRRALLALAATSDTPKESYRLTDEASIDRIHKAYKKFMIPSV